MARRSSGRDAREKKKVNKDKSSSQQSTSKVPAKKRVPPRAKNAPLPVEKYNALRKAYFEEQNILRAGKIAGVNRETAERYIKGPARPKAGMPPIKELWLEAQAAAQEETHFDLVAFHKDLTPKIQEIIEAHIGELKLHKADIGRRIKAFQDKGGLEPPQLRAAMNEVTASLDRMVRMMERTLGAPDQHIRIDGEGLYKDWSEEELQDYLHTGKRPPGT